MRVRFIRFSVDNAGKLDSLVTREAALRISVSLYLRNQETRWKYYDGLSSLFYVKQLENKFSGRWDRFFAPARIAGFCGFRPRVSTRKAESPQPAGFKKVRAFERSTVQSR